MHNHCPLSSLRLLGLLAFSETRSPTLVVQPFCPTLPRHGSRSIGKHAIEEPPEGLMMGDWGGIGPESRLPRSLGQVTTFDLYWVVVSALLSCWLVYTNCVLGKRIML